MKKLTLLTLTAITAAALTSACSKSNPSAPAAPQAQAPAPAPAPGTDDGKVIEPTGTETLPAPTRRLILNNRYKASLGQGITAEWSTTAKCLEGDTKTVAYEKPTVTYRLRKAVGKTVTGEKRNLLVAEMVVLTAESVLVDAQPNEKAASSTVEELTAKCGVGAVTKIYSGVRAAKAFAVNEEQSAKVAEFELSEKDLAAPKAKDFASLVAKATEGLGAEAGTLKIDGLGQGAIEGAASFEEALEAVRAAALTTDGGPVKGKPVEGDVTAYSAELKAKIIPNVFTEEKK